MNAALHKILLCSWCALVNLTRNQCRLAATQSLFRLSTALALYCAAFSAQGAFPNDLSDVEFIEAVQVKFWPASASFNSMSVGGGVITMPYSAANSWPVININNTNVVANVWGIVRVNGRWKAGTWDWMRPGQIAKNQAAFGGCCHFKAGIGNFTPRNGDIFGFFFSGTARSGVVNTAQRTNFLVYEWGKGVIGREGSVNLPPEPEPEPELPLVPLAAINLLLLDSAESEEAVEPIFNPAYLFLLLLQD